MLSDLKQALRSLVKTPGFTIIVLLTLALGTGATIAVFSIVNGVLLRQPPFAQPERLARIYSEFPNFPNGGEHRFVLSPLEYVELRKEAKSWQSVDGWRSDGANIASAAQPERVTVTSVTGGLLPSLGVAASAGRIITPQDDQPGAPPVALLSYRLWQQTFGGDRAAVNRDMLVNGTKFRVIGIMPRDFRFPLGTAGESDLWIPLQIDPLHPNNSAHSVRVMGRLKPGVTLPQAQAELNSLVEYWGRTQSGHHLDPRDHTLVTYRLHEELGREARPALQMLFGAVCFLLLIACVNVANLLLGRADARQREIVIRGALGAGVWRLARQFTIEGTLLSSGGAAIGLLFAWGSLQFIKSASAADVLRGGNATIDGLVVVFAVGVSLLTGLSFGLAPLVHVLKRNLYEALRSTAGATTGAAGVQRFRQALIVGQLALALVLLAGTGLMLRTSWKLLQVDAGFDPRGVTTMAVSLPDVGYTGEAALNFWARLQERLTSLPGVASATITNDLPPVFEGNSGVGTTIEGFVPYNGGPPELINPSGEKLQLVDHYHAVTPSYFATLRIRLVEGRLFDQRDGAQTPRVAIVNQAMARAFWPDDSPLGRRVRPSGSPDWYTVVGIVADAKNDGVEKPTLAELYLPYPQFPAIDIGAYGYTVYIAIRTLGDPSVVVNEVRREVHDLDPTLPITKVRTMEEVVSATQSRPQFLTMVLTLFAGVALALAAIGVYGVISYAVSQRIKEFGLRMAMGAQRSDVLRLVLGRGLLLIVSGLVVGLTGALASTRLLASFLFGVTATDISTFVAVSVLLGVVATAASYVPAHRATKVDPLVALRAE